MKIEVEHRDFVQKDDLADRFAARYGIRPIVEIQDILIHLLNDDGQRISTVTHSTTKKLTFPIDKETFEVLSIYDIRFHLDNGRLELVEGLIRETYLNGGRIAANGPEALAEVVLLDRLATRKGG